MTAHDFEEPHNTANSNLAGVSLFVPKIGGRWAIGNKIKHRINCFCMFLLLFAVIVCYHKRNHLDIKP